jgi:hypothetical protein
VETGLQLFGDSRAADEVPFFQHGRFQPRFGQVRAVDQPVVAASDYDCVVFFGHFFLEVKSDK